MATTLVVQIQNLDQIRARFKAAPMRVSQELHTALLKSGVVIQRLARQEAPTDRGILRNKIAYKMGNGSVEIGPTGSKYAVWVHEGTKPHFPPIKAITGKEETLDLWARRHGLDAYAVARSIARKGTEANPFMDRAAKLGRNDVYRLFDKAVERIVEAV